MERFRIFTTQIALISRNIRKIKSEEMSEFDLKSPHVSCLYYLYKHSEGMTAKQLSDMCGEDKAAISRSIDSLEKKGYLECNSKAEKRYNSPLVLTKSGRDIGGRIAIKVDHILDLAGAGLTDKTRNEFYESLLLISNNLQKICGR